MTKMRATAKMPRGVLQRYRTRMMTAEGDTFDEPSPKWSRFYAQHGWAHEVSDEPAPAPRKRGRPPKAQPPEAAGGSVKANEYAPPLEDKTVSELREMAEDKGVDLPSGYVRKDELVEMLEETGEQTKVDD